MLRLFRLISPLYSKKLPHFKKFSFSPSVPRVTQTRRISTQKRPFSNSPQRSTAFMDIAAEGPVYDRAWWRESIIYQVYVHSFKDTTGNGIGDLNGVTEKLPYLDELGVDIIWLSPVYESPLTDMGYDISNYQSINPLYGGMEEWKRLLDEAGKHNIKLIMDLVVNHTSNEHYWFKESRQSRDNPKHDWYIWKDPVFNAKGERQPPNNWESSFGGPAWEWEEHRKQYYMHLFAIDQPDLNWDNPDVRAAVFDMMKFWLDRGIHGFRMDVINHISKVHGLPDAAISNPNSVTQQAGAMYSNGPNVHQYLNEMNKKVLSHYDCMSVGEMPGDLNPYEASKYVAKERKELSMVFQFAHMNIEDGPSGKWDVRPWKLTELKTGIQTWQQHMLGVHGWNSIFFENHDQPRSLSRFLRDERKYRDKAMKCLATLQLSLRGTIFIYQGQEIAMAHPRGWGIEDYKDIETLNFYKAAMESRPSKGKTDEKVATEIEDIMWRIYKKSRDNARTPMQWSDKPNAGFTEPNVTPWLKVNDDYRSWNVEDQMKDQNSVWNYYRSMIHLRKTHPPFFYGGYTPVDEENEDVFAFLRTQGNFGYLIVLNWKAGNTDWTVPEDIHLGQSILMIGNYTGRDRHLTRQLKLEPYEARIYTIRL